jgi:hypothetical protein
MTRSAGKQQAVVPEKIAAQMRAEQELRDCYESWYKTCLEEGRIERLASCVFREVQRLQLEVGQGQVDKISERFAAAVKNSEASIQPRRKITYLNMVATIRELSELNIKWYKAAPRSKPDQAWMLRQTRHLMLEIAAGNIDNLAERFSLLAEMLPAAPAKDPASLEGEEEIEARQ